jgi:hypothetical protein
MIKHEKFQDIVNKDFGESLTNLLQCRTFKDFCEELNSISENYESYGYQDSIVEDETLPGSLKFRGDLFEIFAEIFFKINDADNRIGVFGYEPVQSHDDNGVDGTSKNIEGLSTTIQVKYRLNPTYLLKERDIKQFAFQSILKYNVDLKQSNNMIVFTNCEGLHWYTESNVFLNKIRSINGDFISRMIDNNEGFWNSAKNLVNETLQKIGIDYIQI